ncbi:hypothetical protein LZ016_01860 [Sphingomonas sp. SM33]|uniref:Uncharacterized protein n=1 Tax=Sphingomonas telluris TaxID=2907998 RepID=A0ABS9VJG4_9SPHN|nr:hypothetical protein [Sphingomonas telluris]MCH8614853.1 hypothetical protein [Sphingomonas telluris]
MLWLLVFAQAVPSVPAPPRVQAKAAVRVMRADKVTAETWAKAGPAARRELLRTDEGGRPIVIRTIEHQ